MVRCAKDISSFAPSSPGKFSVSGDLGFSRRCFVSTRHAHGFDLSYSANVALAGGGTMALDLHSGRSDESLWMRHGMAERALIIVHRIGQGNFPAQLSSLFIAARIDLQRVRPTRRVATGRLVLDVVVSHRL